MNSQQHINSENDPTIKSTVIISVYKDAESLDLILRALKAQSVCDFEVIVSEDCTSDEIKNYIKSQNTFSNIVHLYQPDTGFRKNRALNRAILASRSDHMILIDGDCIPHTNFVEAHQKFKSEGIACTGRRVELGPIYSEKIRKGNISLAELNQPVNYIKNLISLIRDNANDYSLGLPLSFLQPMTKNRSINILGCNFSFHKNDILKVNGFNEDYEMPGIGEDTDIDWRLRSIGVAIKSVKYSAKLYHLHHEKGYSRSSINLEILRRTQDLGQSRCLHGINQRKISQ